MGKRDSYRMVPEDDLDWMAFWEKYPNRVAKKDARRAWAQMKPSKAVVAQILESLDWQIAEWQRKGDWYSPPYPASYLRAERWTDQAPKPMRQAQISAGGMTVLETLLGREHE